MKLPSECTLEQIKIERARRSLVKFTEYTMPEYEVNWHHHLFCSYLDKFVDGDIKRLMIFCPPRHGKLVADSVPVLTRDGWKTHGDLKVGDYVYSPSGEAIPVVAVSPPDDANMEITMTNGDKFKVHENHEWTVFDRRKGKQDFKTYETEYFRSHAVMIGSFYPYQLPSRNPLHFTKKGLKSPYVKGMEIEQFERLPREYMEGSVSQRKEFLAGIIDHSSYVSMNRTVRISVIGDDLLKDMMELVRSLGMEPYISNQDPHKNIFEDYKVLGFVVSTYLPTKVKKLLPHKPKPVFVKSVRYLRKSSYEKGKCIQVDSEDGLYLIGESLTPTHNSELVSRRLPAYIFGKYPDKSVIATSYGADLSSRMNRDVQRIISSPRYKEIFPKTNLWEKNIRTVADGSYLRNSEIFEIVNHKGVYRSAGVGGGITGMGGHYLICLPAGQMLHTNLGLIDIKDIVESRLDCLILSYNHEKGCLEYKQIEEYEKNPGREIYEIDLGDRVLECTGDHPVYVAGKGYIRADQIEEGAVVLLVDNLYAEVLAVRKMVEIPKHVYNVRVKDNHNYFASGILVHNCDDPIKNAEEAYSKVYREKVWEWFTSTFFTRLEKDGGICITLTRWNADDVAGRLLKLKNAGDWTVVTLPAVREDLDNPEDPRKMGEALWPNKYSLEDLTNIRNTVGTRDWDALFRQQPTSESGNMFKSQYWKYYTKSQLPPEFDFISISCDMAFKDSKTSDYVVMQVWGKINVQYYLLDQIRDRLDFLNTLKSLLMLAIKWKNLMECLIEEKANGAAIIQTVRDKIPSVIPIVPKESKEARAASCVPIVEAGNVFLPSKEDAPWVEDFVTELQEFPKAKHDDQCFPAWVAITCLGGKLPISSVQVGERISTPTGFHKVLEVFKSKSKDLMRIKFRDMTSLEVTRNHPIYLPSEGVFVEAGLLKVGDILCKDLFLSFPLRSDLVDCFKEVRSCRSLDKILPIKPATVYSGLAFISKPQELKEIIAIEDLDIEEDVYNLKVESNPCFFANGILVHNCDAFTQYLNHQNKGFGWADKLMDHLDREDDDIGIKNLFWN